ncbi:SRPBCC domain-containing protein [Cellulosimicrobium terreum]|nr:SRPBCC domain-containing protein [Cellulosimicrobium terreum]
MSTDQLPDLVTEVTVPTGPDRAFALFVDEIGAWWPLAGFSSGGADSSVAFERAPDGRPARLVETLADGTTTDWGTVTAWDPPHAVAFTWHPGARADAATQVEVTFAPATSDDTGDGRADHDGSSSTLVVLTHSGWDARSDAPSARARYETGWDVVLAPFIDRTTDEPGPGRTPPVSSTEEGPA